MRRHPERIEQAGIVKLLRSLGAVVYVLGTNRRKGDFQGTMQTPGLPDLIAFLYVPPALRESIVWPRRIVCIEVKAPKGRMSAEQREFAERCSEARVGHVVGGIDAVIAWMVDEGYLRADQVAHYRTRGAK